MSKGNKPEGKEEVVDAMGGGEVVPAATTAVAAAQVQGVQLDFPFIRLGQGMSTWKTNEGKKPQIGCFYVGRNKESNVLIAEEGKEHGFTGILLDVVQGFKERRKWQAGMGAPQRWIVAGTKEDGTPVTQADALAAAAKEGFSLELRETGEVWPDSGRPILAANLDRFCYVLMLVQVPDTFESDDFRLVPIGDHLYTTARYEFDKQYWKSVMAVLGNIEARAKFAFTQEQKKLLQGGKTDKDQYEKALAGYRWSVHGLAAHIYSAQATSRSGVEYTSPFFERALRDGKPWEFTPAEKADFLSFCMSVKAGVEGLDEAEPDEF